jgi:hypothetical protein
MPHTWSYFWVESRDMCNYFWPHVYEGIRRKVLHLDARKGGRVLQYVCIKMSIPCIEYIAGILPVYASKLKESSACMQVH